MLTETQALEKQDLTQNCLGLRALHWTRRGPQSSWWTDEPLLAARPGFSTAPCNATSPLSRARNAMLNSASIKAGIVHTQSLLQALGAIAQDVQLQPTQSPFTKRRRIVSLHSRLLSTHSPAAAAAPAFMPRQPSQHRSSWVPCPSCTWK